MRLKYFDLDLPYIENENRIKKIIRENSCTKDEAIKIDYQIYWKNKRREFSLQTRCITAFFERLFGYVDTTDCKKIIIECVPKVFDEQIKNFSGIYCLQAESDHNSFLKAKEIDKKIMALELLMTGIKKIVQIKNWDIEPFAKVYKKIIEQEYKNKWIWKKPVKCPNKKNLASVLLEHEVEEINISIIITDNFGNTIMKKHIITEIPDEWIYTKHLGEIKWIDNNKIKLINNSKDEEWIIDIK